MDTFYFFSLLKWEACALSTLAMAHESSEDKKRKTVPIALQTNWSVDKQMQYPVEKREREVKKKTNSNFI